MMHLLSGPLLRQGIQFFAGVVAATGIASESEVTTLVGAASSIANIAWMVFARVKAP